MFLVLFTVQDSKRIWQTGVVVAGREKRIIEGSKIGIERSAGK